MSTATSGGYRRLRQLIWPVEVLLGRSSGTGWQGLSAHFKPHRGPLLGFAVLSIASVLMIVPILMLVRMIFDKAIPHSDVRLLLTVGALVFLIRSASAILAVIARRGIVGVVKTIVGSIRKDLIAKVYSLERSDLSSQDIDRLHTQIVHDSERVDVQLTAIWSNLIPSAITAFVLLCVLSFFSWKLILLTAVLAPVTILLARKTQASVAGSVTRFQSDFERFSRGVSFVIRQIDLTRTLAYQDEELRRQQESVDTLARSGERMNWSFSIHGQLQSTVIGSIGIVVLVAGGLEVISGHLSVGQFLSFYLGAGMLGNSLTGTMRGTAEVIAGGVSLSTLGRIADARSAPAYGGGRKLHFRGGLEARRVSFSYHDDIVIDEASLKLEPGEQVALVGPNGSGKSTFLNLILGLLRPSSGVVLADGIEYSELDLDHLRRQTGVVMQRAAFFFGTVRANLTYGIPAADETLIQETLRVSGCAEFVAELPLGLDTVVGDTGVTLSGGQCQRLAIARALLRRPRLLVLDEPTNHLDADFVGTFLRDLKGLPESPTIILVSHDPRLAAIMQKTYLLRDGKLSLTPAQI